MSGAEIAMPRDLGDEIHEQNIGLVRRIERGGQAVVDTAERLNETLAEFFAERWDPLKFPRVTGGARNEDR